MKLVMLDEHTGRMIDRDTGKAAASVIDRNLCGLLCAAPDLLEALRALVGYMEWDGHMQRWAFQPSMPAGTVTAARAAIAKASA